VYALAVGDDGTLYIGGDFTNWNSDADSDYIVSWDGSSYAALSSGANAIVYALAVGPAGTLYAGGNFTTIGGESANRVAEWDGSSWSAMGDGFGDEVRAIVVKGDGTVFVGGDFPASSPSDPPYHVAEWTGSAWVDLDNGVTDSDNSSFYHSGDVRDLALGPDGALYVVGDFSYIGSDLRDVENGLARWNGTSWSMIDFDNGASIVFNAVAIGSADPVIESSYDVYYGADAEAFAYAGATTTGTNDGTEPAYPIIVIELLTDGTTTEAVLVRNETTGKELLLDYILQEEETLTIDLRPGRKSVVSNFYGPVPQAVLPDSDFGTFVLQPGDNLITVYLDHKTGTALAEMEVSVRWQDTYGSQD
jgi:hypothetical protein